MRALRVFGLSLALMAVSAVAAAIPPPTKAELAVKNVSIDFATGNLAGANFDRAVYRVGDLADFERSLELRLAYDGASASLSKNSMLAFSPTTGARYPRFVEPG